MAKERESEEAASRSRKSWERENEVANTETERECADSYVERERGTVDVQKREYSR